MAWYRVYHGIPQFDLTDEQKLELVNAIATIVESIFDRHLNLNQLKLKKYLKRLLIARYSIVKSATQETLPEKKG